MPVTIKTEQEIEGMRKSCALLSQVHEEMHAFLKPGISTLDIDTFCESLIRKMGGTPNFKNYEGYPASVCVSVNDEVVHGIPRADRIIQEGDIVSLDAGMIVDGWHSDAARTWGVGEIHPLAQQLIDVTRLSFFAGIKAAKDGGHLYDIGRAIQKFVRPYHYGIVRELTGHGIGRSMHEEPYIPNYAKFSRGLKLEKGMTLAVEPMINLGTRKIAWLDDEWTVVTLDGAPSAHYENTIVVTDGSPEILTLSADERAAAKAEGLI